MATLKSKRKITNVDSAKAPVRSKLAPSGTLFALAARFPNLVDHMNSIDRLDSREAEKAYRVLNREIDTLRDFILTAQAETRGDAVAQLLLCFSFMDVVRDHDLFDEQYRKDCIEALETGLGSALACLAVADKISLDAIGGDYFGKPNAILGSAGR